MVRRLDLFRSAANGGIDKLTDPASPRTSPGAFARTCLLPRSGLVVIDGSADEIFQGALVDLVALEKIDRSSRIAFKARVAPPAVR